MARACWIAVAAVALWTAPVDAADAVKPAEETEGKIPADTVQPGGVLLRLDSVDMPKVVELYSRITGKIVIPSPDARGKVTIINRERLKPQEAARLIESALELQGWTMIPQGNIAKLVKSREAVKRLLPTGEPGSEKVLENVSRMQTFLVPVRYITADEVRNLIAPLLSNDATIQVNERTNLLVITEIGTNMARLLELIQKVDRPLSTDEDAIESVKLKHVDPKKMMDDIATYVKGGGLTFVPNDRLQVLVVNGKRRDVERAKRIIALLDLPVEEGQNTNQIINIKYAKAQDIAELLLKLYKNRPEAPPATFSVNFDKSSNTVILTGPPQLRTEIAQLIAQVDTRYKQVLLKVLVCEVNKMPTRSLGVQWEFFKNSYNIANTLTGPLTGTMRDDPVRRATPGFRYSVIQPAGYSHFITALESTDNFNVLASPQITVASNHKATFNVADQVPIQTASRVSDNSNVQVNSNSFKEAGLKLNVEPSITPDHEVALDLEFEFTEVGARDPIIPNPTFSTRQANTSVLVKDEHTLVLAGLMRRDHTRAQDGVPFFGRLPGLGPLFRTRVDSSAKQEIVVLITPTVLATIGESDSVSEGYLLHASKNGGHSSYPRSFVETERYFRRLAHEEKHAAHQSEGPDARPMDCESPLDKPAPAPSAVPAPPPDGGRAEPPLGAAAVTPLPPRATSIEELLARRRAAKAEEKK